MAQTRDFASLTQSVLQMIRKDIVTCALPPGAVIRDNDLAARYGVSTSPIREALVRLAAERLVVMPPNKPKRVMPLDAESARALYSAFRILALAGFSLGAPRITSNHLVRMQLALAALDVALEGEDRYAMAIRLRDFVLPVYQASGNAELVDILTQRLNGVDRLIICFNALRKPEISYKFKRILDCFLAGDFTQAIQIHFQLTEATQREIADFAFGEAGYSKPMQW